MVENNKYTVAIDLGESSVVVVVGSKTEEGLISIDSVATRPCEGVKGGMIDNIALVEEAIKGAVMESEQRLGIRILEAYAGISGEFVRFACHSDHVYVSDHQNGVAQSDVDALFERMKHVQAPDNETIMERIPQNYIVDDSKEVKNPVGSFGRRLSSTFNFILCANTPMQRLENALRRIGIKLIKSLPNALCVADSVLCPEEKEEGAVVVDLGGGLTDITIYYRNVVRYIASIPMGASAINNDIRSMMIPDKYIESLKQQCGSAVADLVPENKAVRVNGRTPRESKEILLYNLAVAIEARVAMLIDFIKREIKDSGYEGKLPYGIVLTGGSANLKNIDILFKRMTDMEVRIAYPTESLCEESLNAVASPEYATAVGILIRGIAQGCCTTEQMSKPQPQVEEPKSVKVEEPKSMRVEQESHAPHTPQSPAAKQPPRVATSEVYTPPPTRPYTPPKPAVQQPAEQSKAVDNNPYAEHRAVHENIAEESEEILTPMESSESIDDFAEEQHNVTIPPKSNKGRDWGRLFRSAIDKLNDGFNAAGDEEI